VTDNAERERAVVIAAVSLHWVLHYYYYYYYFLLLLLSLSSSSLI